MRAKGGDEPLQRHVSVPSQAAKALRRPQRPQRACAPGVTTHRCSGACAPHGPSSVGGNQL